MTDGETTIGMAKPGRPRHGWRPPGWTLSCLIVWLLLGLTLGVEYWALLGVLKPAQILAGYSLFLLAGAALALACLVAAFWRRGAILSALGFVAGAAALILASSALHDTGAFIKFMMSKGEYDQATAVAQTGALESSDSVRIDEGPPIRVAFVWQGGAGAWAGVVHDDSGAAAAARETAPVRMFGGALVACRPLTKAYYFCAFVRPTS